MWKDSLNPDATETPVKASYPVQHWGERFWFKAYEEVCINSSSFILQMLTIFKGGQVIFLVWWLTIRVTTLALITKCYAWKTRSHCMMNEHCHTYIGCSIFKTLYNHALHHQFAISLSSPYPLFFHGPNNRHSKILWHTFCTLANIEIRCGFRVMKMRRKTNIQM